MYDPNKEVKRVSSAWRTKKGGRERDCKIERSCEIVIKVSPVVRLKHQGGGLSKLRFKTNCILMFNSQYIKVDVLPWIESLISFYFYNNSFCWNSVLKNSCQNNVKRLRALLVKRIF